MGRFAVFMLVLAYAMAVTALLAAQAQARPPRPDPHPAAKGKKVKWHKRTYIFEIRDPQGRYVLRCKVPFRGPRTCDITINLGRL